MMHFFLLLNPLSPECHKSIFNMASLLQFLDQVTTFSLPTNVTLKIATCLKDESPKKYLSRFLRTFAKNCLSYCLTVFIRIFECLYVLQQFANNDAGWCAVMRKRVFATAMTSVHNWFLFVPFVIFSCLLSMSIQGTTLLRMTQL